MSKNNHPNIFSQKSVQPTVMNPTQRTNKGGVVLHAESQEIHIRQSNMPDVETLEGYAKFIPGGAERLLALIERQSAHRIELEAKVIPEQLKQSSRGQWFGFILAIMAFVVSLVFLFKGNSYWAGWIATSTAIGMATIFVVGKFAVKENLNQKRPPTVQPPQPKNHIETK